MACLLPRCGSREGYQTPLCPGHDRLLQVRDRKLHGKLCYAYNQQLRSEPQRYYRLADQAIGILMGRTTILMAAR